MSKSNDFETGYLQLVFQNATLAGIGDATGLRGSTVPGSLYLTLHTADPGEAGTAITNETAYTGYARQAVVRSGAGWSVVANSVSPVNNIDFPECTAGAGAAITHFGVVASVSGAGLLLYKGTLTPNITMAVGVIPRIKNTTTITED